MGAIGGLAGAYVMGRGHALWEKAVQEFAPPQKEPQTEDATVKTANAISRRLLDRELTEAEKKWAGPFVHYAFGTVAGACYGAIVETIPRAKTAFGIAYGAALWLAADEIGVPGFGLSPTPSEIEVFEHLKGLISHLIYGVTTELTRKLVLATEQKAAN